jgi:hypothetical protein
MLKKLLIGIISVGFMTLLVNTTYAGWPALPNGDWGSVWTGSVDCKMIWQARGGTSDSAAIECAILPVKLATQCVNPAGNMGYGVVFDINGDQSASSEVNIPEGALSSKGTTGVGVEINDEALFDVLLTGPGNICDEFNGGSSLWEGLPLDQGGYINIYKMFVAFRAWIDDDDNGSYETLVEDGHLACRVPDDTNFEDNADDKYDCIELYDATKKDVGTAYLTDYDWYGDGIDALIDAAYPSN